MNILKLDNEIFLCKDFLTIDECHIFCDVAQQVSEDEWKIANPEKKQWFSNRIFSILNSEWAMDLCGELLVDVEKRYREVFNNLIPDKSLKFVDNKAIYKAGPGMHMPSHHDVGGNPKVTHGIVTYINDTYTGGEIYYPKISISLKPEAGSMVIHPSDLKHTHGVKKVIAGTRYSMANFIENSVDWKHYLWYNILILA